ncbi:MAG: serine hydrolase [Bryobacteraceae bacterium]|nr:serine hydrolase [Bryobacteraceae bacterium]
MCLRLVAFALAATLILAQPSPYESQVLPYVKNGQFMGVVLVAKDGKVLYQQAFGQAVAEWEVPHTLDSKFRIGSITKQFTAVAILRLAEQSKISLQDPVKKYYPAAPAAWDGITVHHLLNHTSGIPSYTNQPGFLDKSALTAAPAEILKPILALPLEFAPGQEFKYDNSGYLLLGLIIESLTGAKYADHLRTTIFEPLGMKDTGYDVSATMLKHRSAGYVRAGAELRNAPYTDMQWPFAAGGLYSTAADLLKWDQALNTDRLLSAASKEKMYQPGLSSYGYGWFTRKIGTHPVADHGGGIQGFNTHITRVLDERVVTIVLANLNTPAASALSLELARAAVGLPAKEAFEEISVSVDKLKDYEGVYPLAATFSLVVRPGTPMTIQGTGQPRLPVFSYAADKFFAKAIDAQVEFTRDAAGKVDGLIVHQNGMDLKGKRQSAQAPAERVELPLDMVKAAEYPGTYTIEGAPVTMTVALTDGKLTAQLTGQSAFPLYRSGPEEFFLKVVDAQIKFLRDMGGKVEAVQLNQNGQEIRWMRQKP